VNLTPSFNNVQIDLDALKDNRMQKLFFLLGAWIQRHEQFPFSLFNQVDLARNLRVNLKPVPESQKVWEREILWQAGQRQELMHVRVCISVHVSVHENQENILLAFSVCLSHEEGEISVRDPQDDRDIIKLPLQVPMVLDVEE
jgi:hypothetical protein